MSIYYIMSCFLGLNLNNFSSDQLKHATRSLGCTKCILTGQTHSIQPVPTYLNCIIIEILLNKGWEPSKNFTLIPNKPLKHMLKVVRARFDQKP